MSRQILLSQEPDECPGCHSVQLRLLDWIHAPVAIWQCRHCRLKFYFEIIKDAVSEPDKPKFWPGPAGALLCDREVKGLTQELSFANTIYYGGQYFVGESIPCRAAKVIAEALGGEYLDGKPE